MTDKHIDAAIVAIANHHEILVGEFPYLAVDKDFKKTILQALHFMRDHQWQPIDTAPMDGTEILVGKKHPIEDAGYSEVVQVFCKNGKWYVFGEYFLAWEPTHWMPLPVPPKGYDE